MKFLKRLFSKGGSGGGGKKVSGRADYGNAKGAIAFVIWGTILCYSLIIGLIILLFMQ
jgi:hypothetical protein